MRTLAYLLRLALNEGSGRSDGAEASFLVSDIVDTMGVRLVDLEKQAALHLPGLRL